jgi:hypothetical protein
MPLHYDTQLECWSVGRVVVVPSRETLADTQRPGQPVKVQHLRRPAAARLPLARPPGSLGCFPPSFEKAKSKAFPPWCWLHLFPKYADLPCTSHVSILPWYLTTRAGYTAFRSLLVPLTLSAEL